MFLDYLSILLKLIIFFSLMNVWFVRFSKPTPYRGGNARSMKEEFDVYGISPAGMYAVGAIKVLLAMLLIFSIWQDFYSIPAAGGMGIMMLGAIAMHIKVDDPGIRSFPAVLFLLMCVVIVLIDTFKSLP